MRDVTCCIAIIAYVVLLISVILCVRGNYRAVYAFIVSFAVIVIAMFIKIIL